MSKRKKRGKKTMSKTKTMLRAVVKKKSKKEASLLNVKVTDEQREAIQKKADQYAKGNVSAWLRYAGTSANPRKKDLTKAA